MAGRNKKADKPKSESGNVFNEKNSRLSKIDTGETIPQGLKDAIETINIEALDEYIKKNSPTARYWKGYHLWSNADGSDKEKVEATKLINLAVLQNQSNNGKREALEFYRSNILKARKNENRPLSTGKKTVVIAGATGDVGFHIAKAFLKYSNYKIRILRHEGCSESGVKSERADVLEKEGAEVKEVKYAKKDLVEALEGASFVVSALGMGSVPKCYDSQLELLKAMLEINEAFSKTGEGIKIERFIPSEFNLDYGSIDEAEIIGKISTDNLWMHRAKTNFRKALEKRKIEIKNKVESLTNSTAAELNYTYLCSGLSFEYVGWFGFNSPKKKATLFAKGEKRVSLTSLADIGKCVVELLDKEEFINKTVKVAAVTLSLDDLYTKFTEKDAEDWAKENYADNTDYIFGGEFFEDVQNIQSNFLDLGENDLNNDVFSFKFDKDLDRVIELFIKTRLQKQDDLRQIDLGCVHYFPNLLEDIFNPLT